MRELLGPLGGLVAIGGALVGAYELAFWLKNGTWRHLTLIDVWGPYQAQDWSGVTQIMVWLHAQPLWGVLLVAGIVLALLGGEKGR